MTGQADTHYSVAVHQEDGVFWAEVTDLPGCFASGETLDELWEALQEAIGLYLAEHSTQTNAVPATPPPRASMQLDAIRILVPA